MKRSSLFTPALALAFGLCASGAWALTTTNAFENFDCAADTLVGSLPTANGFGFTWSAGADAADYTYAEASTGKLVVDTGDSSVTGALANATAFNNNIANSASFEAKVTFTPATETPDVGGSDLKFALYTKAETGTTNLYVYASGAEKATGLAVPANVEKTVKVTFAANDEFSVFVNDVAASGNPYTFANSGTITKVEFQGNGKVDDLGFTYAATETDVSWPTTMSVVSYTVNGGTPVALTAAAGSAKIYGEPGDAIVLTLTNADGVSKTVNGTAGTAIDATGVTYTWADYLGDAIAADTYGIDNLAELKLFQKGVANTNDLTTANTTFKLTADIVLDEAWPGIGLQNGKDVYNTQQFNDEAFLGTFDGQNYTISGFQMVGGGLDYCGFFNSTYGATIQNLKIAYAGSLFATDTAKNSSAESGATFVGVAKNSTLCNLTTVAGTVSCDKGFGGIAGYTTRGTVIDSCTNNVNMTSLKPNKCGGIAMITQNGDGDSPIIRNCQNNGTIAGSNETGGLIGYIGNCGAVISNCESTVAYKLFHAQDATPTVAGIIKGSASVAPSYTYANDHTVSGLNFATFDGNVATFVTDGVLAAGNTYKVLAPSATATFEFTATGTIAFDTALATPTYAITAAEGLTLTDATSGTVKTYTATVTQYTVTVSGDTSNLTATWTVNGSTVSAPATLNHGDSYSVTFAPATGYKFSDGQTTTFSGTATAAVAITAPLVEAEVSYSAGDNPVDDDSSYTISTAEANYLNALVTEKGADAVETALDGISAQAFANAVLLNQDITAEGFTGAAPTFEISNIKNVSGGIEIEVTLQPASKMLGNTINGNINLYAYNKDTGKFAKVTGKVFEFTSTFDNYSTTPAATTATVTFEGASYDIFKAVIEEKE